MLPAPEAVLEGESTLAARCYWQFSGHQEPCWMSGSPSSLVLELQALRRDLADLQTRVLALELRDSSEAAAPFASPVTVNYSVSGGAQQYPALPPFPFSSPGELLALIFLPQRLQRHLLLRLDLSTILRLSGVRLL